MNKYLFLGLLAASYIGLAAAQCTVNGQEVDVEAIQGQLDNIKKGVKIAAIVVPILGGLLLIVLVLVLYLLVRCLGKIKRKLPLPKDMGLIKFLRNLDNLDLGVSVNTDVNLTVDVEKKGRKENDEEEEERKRKEEEERRKKNREERKKEEEKNDDEETRKRRRERRGKSDREFNLRAELKSKGSVSIKHKELAIEYGYPLARGVFHVTYRAKYNGEDVVVRKISYPLDSDDLLLQEIFEEDQRRVRITGLKSEYIVPHVGTLADWPDFGFVSRFYARGSLYTDLVERRTKVNFSAKEIAKIALDVATAVKTLHDAGIAVKMVAARNIILDKDGSNIRARLDLNFEPSIAGTMYGRQHAYVGPVSWMAPESLETKKFTVKSDIFSFGVFLWELVARADPFEERSSIGVACPVLHKGLRLTVPSSAPEAFKTLIEGCFESDADSRPSIADIHAELKSHYESQ